VTLSFNWATNLNYSTGPDLGSATKIDPASATNGFIAGTVIAPQHVNFLVNLIADQLLDALDGAGGGTYTLTAPLIFAAGDDLRINNTLEVLASGQIDFNASSNCTFQATSNFSMNTDMQVGATGSIVCAAGASITLEDGDDLVINDDDDSWLLTLTPQSQSFDAGTLAPTWLPLPSGAGWFQHDVGSARQIVFPLNLPPGDDIVSATIRVDGAGAGAGHASLPAGGDRLLVSIVGVSALGVATTLASRADQSPDVATYDTNHIITLASGSLDSGSLPQTTNAVTRYYIVIAGEHGANAVADTTTITSIGGVCTARAYRSDTMVY
jgi:hypothetical protein